MEHLLTFRITRATVVRRKHHPDNILFNLTEDQVNLIHRKYSDIFPTGTLKMTVTAGHGVIALVSLGIPEELIELNED